MITNIFLGFVPRIERLTESELSQLIKTRKAMEISYIFSKITSMQIDYLYQSI